MAETSLVEHIISNVTIDFFNNYREILDMYGKFTSEQLDGSSRSQRITV